MITRLAALLFLGWAWGFALFALLLPGPAPDDSRTGLVVALTGAPRRIDQAVEVLRARDARSLLVSGVDREVTRAEFAREFRIEPPLMRCCITLGTQAVDTRTNALETARWVAARKGRSVRVVTTDWHMRRALFELRRTMPDGVVLVPDAVRSDPDLGTLFREYHKLLAVRGADLMGY